MSFWGCSLSYFDPLLLGTATKGEAKENIMAIKTQKFNKTEFIRARPNMQPMDIVEEAAKLGHLIKVNLIWNTRSKDRKATGAETTGKKASKKAKKVSTQVVQDTEVSAEATFNKSDFIRKRPNKSAADISTEAEALGQDIPPQMVWSIRSADKKKKVAAADPPKRVAKRVAKKVAKARKVSKPTAKRVSPVSMQPTKVPMTGSSAFAQTRNGNKVTLVVFDPRDPKAVKAATAAMREAANA
jgi:hypothetical protein